MNRNLELLMEIEQKGLTQQFAEAIALDIRDQAEFVIEEDQALVAMLKTAVTTIENGTSPPDTGLLVAEFFLGVESIEHYMEDFLSGCTIPGRQR